MLLQVLGAGPEMNLELSVDRVEHQLEAMVLAHIMDMVEAIQILVLVGLVIFRAEMVPHRLAVLVELMVIGVEAVGMDFMVAAPVGPMRVLELAEVVEQVELGH